MDIVFPGLKSARVLWVGGLSSLVAVLLAACVDEPSPTPRPYRLETPIPMAAVVPTLESSLSPTPTTTPNPTALQTSATPTNAAKPEVALDGAMTPSPTAKHTPTAEPAPTAVQTHTPMSSPTPTVTASPTPSPSVTPAQTATHTPTPSPSPTPTPTSTPSPTPTLTPTPSPTPTAEELAAARLSEIVPWFENPPGSDYRDAAEVLVDLWLRDADLGGAVAGLPWVGDRVVGEEIEVLLSLRGIADTDLTLAKQIVGYRWLSDHVTRDEREVIYELENVAANDIGLAMIAVELPWLADDVTGQEREAIDALSNISTQDVGLAKAAASLSWFADGITDDEWRVLNTLNDIASKDIELAGMVASLSWFADGIVDGERRVFGTLNDIASKDIELAGMVASLSWFADGMADDEWLAYAALSRIASKDIELARMVASLPWFGDDVTSIESQDLIRLDDIADRDVEVARIAIGFAQATADVIDVRRGNLRSYVLQSLHTIVWQEEDIVARVTSQPWFIDGLDREEAAFVTMLRDVVYRSPTLYSDLLDARFTQTRTVSLPLAGEVSIWVFQNTPFPPGEDLLGTIEQTARMSEALLGAPFPTTDIILLVVDRSDRWYRIGSGHFDTHMRLIRTSLGNVAHVPHETAHYYFFAPITGPRWLTEGAAELIAAYFNDRTGVEELAGRRARMAVAAHGCVVDQLMENVRHLMSVLANRWEIRYPTGCVYQIGENFLHSASIVMGEKALMSALGELHLSELGREPDTVEARIYEVFMKHAPVDRKEDFRDLYRELHGGAAAFDEPDLSDDHGDEAIAATRVEVRQDVHGRLDYMFDFDYFRFRAHEGQKYRMEVEHDALRTTSIGLYAPDGETGENRFWKARELVSTGPRIVWIAPSSEDYYFAVHNFGGKTGTYTFKITPVERSVLDDHADTPAAATEISVGETVEGTISDEFDIDFLRFQVEAGQRYRLDIASGTLDEFRFRLLMPDQRWRFTAGGYRSMADGFLWTSRISSEASLGIDSTDGDVGTYTVTIVPVD